MAEKLQIRPVTASDKEWVAALLKEWWAGPVIVTHGRTHHADELPGFIAFVNDKPSGLITYEIKAQDCEIVTMNSLIENKGVGSTLVDTVKNTAIKQGSKRIHLVTTNDNTNALHFWQKRGFNIVDVRINAMEEYRKLKPEIPLTGNDGIPLRDEIALEMLL